MPFISKINGSEISASYAVTASYALNGGTPGGPNKSVQFNSNQTFSGSSNFTFDSASNSMILTGSMITTGSNLLLGTTTLTGSLNITGSTTQIGNNTLLGNTLLTGSITISGSFGTNNPTVRIYGDATHNGYIRFDPVTTNIDTSISASYIYVSGSTNDLYFSQNGAGYNNVTRLRWLEGNLYTGLFHGGVITQINSNTYQVASGSGIIVNLNASIPNDPYPTIQFLQWGNLTKTIDALSASYDQQFIAISSSNQIHAQGTPYFDGQIDTYIPVGIVLHQNRSSINGVKTQPSLAYGWKQRSNIFISAFGPLKLSGHALATSSSRGLTVESGTSFADGANYPTDPNNPSYVTDPGTNVSKIFRYRQSGSNFVYDTNAGVGYTTIDPTQYSLNGTLTPVGAGNWSIQRVYWFPNSVSKAIVVYYGNEIYSTLAAATANINIETFSEAPNTAANAIYVGAIIINGTGVFTSPSDYDIIPAGLFRGIGGGGGGGGTTSPGGSNTQIQYNNNGTFGGVTNLTWNGTTLSATGSFTGSFTGSLLGTASYALNGGVTQLLAGPNITLSPTNGLGQVTITSTGGGGVYGNTATGSYGSFYDTTTQTNPVANVIRSMSFNSTDITNGVTISGSVSPFNTYIKTENAGVYDIQFSAQLDKTSTGNTSTTLIWLRKNGIDLAETNTAIELSQNGKGVAAWNWFVNAVANDYFQIMWSSDRTDVQLTATTPAIGPAVPSIIATVNRVDQFLSNTGSFSGSFIGTSTGSLLGTASWAQSSSNTINAQTASFLPVGTYQITSSWATNALTASFLLGSVTSASYAATASIASNVTNGVSFVGSGSIITGSVAISSSYGLYVPANTFTVGDIVKVQGVFTKPTGSSSMNFYIYINTSNSLSGATQLALYQTTTQRWNPITRTLAIESSTSTTLHPTNIAHYNDDIVLTTATARASVNINWAVDQYILFAAQNASLSDRTDTFRFYAKRI